MEIVRFGVGHRRPEGPPGTTGVERPGHHSRRRGHRSPSSPSPRTARIEPHANPNTTWFVVIEGGGFVRGRRADPGRRRRGRAVAARRAAWRVDRPGPYAGDRRGVRGPETRAGHRGPGARLTGSGGVARARVTSLATAAAHHRPDAGEPRLAEPPARERDQEPRSAPRRGSRRLAEDPGRRAPDEEALDPVGAVAQRPSRTVRSTTRSRRRAGTRRAAPRRSGRPRPGRREDRLAAATARTGVNPEAADGDPDGFELPTTRTPAATVQPHLLGRLAQRGRRRVGVVGSALPPGKLTSPLWWPPPITRSVRTTRASPSASGNSSTRTAAGRGRRPAAANARPRRPSRMTGSRAAGACGSGSGQDMAQARDGIGEAHRPIDAPRTQNGPTRRISRPSAVSDARSRRSVQPILRLLVGTRGVRPGGGDAATAHRLPHQPACLPRLRFGRPGARPRRPRPWHRHGREHERAVDNEIRILTLITGA